MSLGHWIEQYGLLGVFLASAAEGEIGVLIGGGLARLGHLNPAMVAAAAWAGSVVATQAMFHIGRSRRDGPWVGRIKHRHSFATTMRWIERWPRLFCFAYRFIYGLRVVGVVGISLSDIDTKSFTVINLLSALLWAIVVTALGWWIGPTAFEKIGQWFDWHDALIVGGGALTMLMIVIAWRRMEPKVE